MRTLRFSMTYRPRSFGRPSDRSQLAQVKQVVESFAPWHPLMREWWFKGDTLEEALLVPLFDQSGEVSAAALEYLRSTSSSESDRFRVVGAWNGNSAALGAQLTHSFAWGEDDRCKVGALIKQGLLPAGSGPVITSMNSLVSAFEPRSLSASSYNYDPIFKDRPGVGWMLYLPRILTPQQVPEARALVPVIDASHQPLGTIIVSVADEVFSDQNPEHTKIAHAIETRLVDQDLLPRFADL
jgi:hypothetical protein